MTPALSVVMPMYNAQDYVARSIDSVLGQDFTDFELIIVNDGSTDASRNVVQGFDDARIRFFENEQNLGLAGARNRALAQVRAPLIACQDADDISLPERFGKQAAHLESNPNTVVVGSSMEVVNERYEHRGWFDLHCSDAMVRWAMYFGHPFAQPTVMMRSAALESVNGYDDAYPFAEDFDLWFRLGEIGRLENLPERLVRYVRHDDSVSIGSRPIQLEYELKVRQRIMQQTLGRAVPMELVNWCPVPPAGKERNAPDKERDLRQIKEFFSVVSELHDIFIASHAVSNKERRTVTRETAAKCVNLAAQAAKHSRPVGAMLFFKAALLDPSLLTSEYLARGLGKLFGNKRGEA